MKAPSPLIAALLLIAYATSATASDAVAAAADLIRNYPQPEIMIESVDVNAGVIRIRGKADANSDISELMRYLQREVGDVTLESVERVDDVSNFYLTIRKLKP